MILNLLFFTIVFILTIVCPSGHQSIAGPSDAIDDLDVLMTEVALEKKHSASATVPNCIQIQDNSEQKLKKQNEDPFYRFCKSDKRNSILDGIVYTESQNLWNSATTPPEHHQKDKFTYIVHGLKPGSFGSDGIKKFLDNPIGITNRLISASVINQDKKGTYGSSCGVILKVPFENIIATSPSDLGTRNSLMTPSIHEKGFDIDLCAELTRLNYNNPILEPSKLLDQTRRYNELAILGSIPGQSSKLKLLESL